MGLRVSETKIEEAMLLNVDRPEFADGETLRRRHRHHRLPHDIAHLLSYLARPIARANNNGGVNGGTAAWIDNETPVLAVIALSRVWPSIYKLRRSYRTNYYGEWWSKAVRPR